MNRLLLKFTEGLNLPRNTHENLYKKRTNEQLKLYALSLPDLEYPDTYYLAGRIYMYSNIKTCPRNIKDYVDILEGILRPEIKEFLLTHSEKIDKVLEDTYYENFKEQTILSASANLIYLLRITHEEPPVETPCHCKLRQAVQFYHKEGLERVLKCYYELLDGLYVHASPTMFNSGCYKNQLGSCYLITLGDNLEDLLYTGVGDAGIISKLQGGIGMHLNSIRHSTIANSGKSGGIMPFGEIYDKNTKCVNQGAKRNGALTLFLNIWHVDVLEFIQARDNYTQNGVRFKSANTALYISNLFMERVKKNKEWTLFCPAKAKLGDRKLDGSYGDEFEKLYLELEKIAIEREESFKAFDNEIKEMELKINGGEELDDKYIKNYYALCRQRVKKRKELIEYKKVNALDLYKTICDMNVKSGMPYITYRDPVNIKNNMMNIGVTEGLNLCLEITEPSSQDSIASCNLGHINLRRYVKKELPESLTKENLKEAFDFKLLAKGMSALVENINKVIDYNYYPLDTISKEDKTKVTKQGKISKSNLDNRPIGIGVSGLAETFALLGLPFDSPLAKHLNKMIFSCMYYHGLEKSHDLALTNGAYASFKSGTSRIYTKNGWQTFQGSPFSNGYLQFDLWKSEAMYLESLGRLDLKVYNKDDNIPISPSEWGYESDWDYIKSLIMKDGIYNSMLLAPMPTASSAQLVRNAEAFEAHQTLIYSRKLVHGNITTFSEPFVYDMIKNKLWNKEMIAFIQMDNGSIRYIHHFIKDHPEHFKDIDFDDKFWEKISYLQKLHRGMYEISQKETMLMSRQRGIYVDQSQSLNIYIPEPTKEKMMSVHAYSYALGLKTGMYYLRQNPASQTDRFTVNLSIKEYYNSLVKSLKTKPVKVAKKIVCNDEVCLMCQ